MINNMKGEEVADATHALLNWLESQEIAPGDAVRVLTTGIVSLIHEISINEGLNAKKGGRVIAKIIVESLP